MNGQETPPEDEMETWRRSGAGILTEALPETVDFTDLLIGLRAGKILARHTLPPSPMLQIYTFRFSDDKRPTTPPDFRWVGREDWNGTPHWSRSMLETPTGVFLHQVEIHPYSWSAWLPEATENETRFEQLASKPVSNVVADRRFDQWCADLLSEGDNPTRRGAAELARSIGKPRRWGHKKLEGVDPAVRLGPGQSRPKRPSK
jgi:hypothetical protein